MSDRITVFSPISGAIVPLAQVPDPVFSEHMLGEGLAIDPTEDTIEAPFDGKIVDFNPASHALVLSCGTIEVLIHVGLETVALKGEGFTPLAKTGDVITRGQPLLRFNPHLLAQKKVCPFVLIVVTTPADTPLQHMAENLIKKGQPLFEIAAEGPSSQPAAPQAFTHSVAITVTNPNGLHARPAGILARLALKYPFAVEIAKGNKTANAKSVVAIMGLAIARNDAITLRAAGPHKEAKDFLTKLEKEFQNAFGEDDSAPMQAASSPAQAFSKKVLTASPGLACGKAFLYQPQTITFCETATNQSVEKKRLDDAIQALVLETEAQISAAPDEETQAILTARLSFLQDPQLLLTARQFIEGKKSAAFGVHQAVAQATQLLQNTGDAFLMERAADLEDLRRALLLHLGAGENTSVQIPQGCILIAQDLLPSDVLLLHKRAAGVLLAKGSPTAHASIMLRNMGIPALVRAGRKVLHIAEGTTICLDADQTLFTVNPSPAQEAAFTARLKQAEQHTQQAAQTAQAPSYTQDGVHILVEGNISSLAEASLAFENGADGLGLVRTEFLFYGAAHAPTLAQQQKNYHSLLTIDSAKPVTIRTLDAGGDKPLPFVHIPAEENPIMGIRGVRAFEANEKFFRTQLRAMLLANQAGNLRIMLPMVTFCWEVDFFRNLIEQEKAALGVSAAVQVGIMVEVPAAALTSAHLAERADFLSLGTNDLTQYTLAIDRGHPDLSAQTDSLHPAVLQLIAHACEGARQHHKPVSICGAMAGDMDAIPLLLGLGVTELAVSAKDIPQVKALVRRLNIQACQTAARKALTMASAQQVRNFVRETFSH